MTRPFIDYTPDGSVLPTLGDLQDAVYRLMAAWRSIDSVRDTASPVRPERAMKPAPGPRAPTSVAVIDTIIDAEDTLREAVIGACVSMAVPKPRKAIPDTVIGLLASRDSWDELSDPTLGYLWSSVVDAASILEGYVARVQPEVKEPPKVEPRLFDWQVIERLAGMGHRVTEDQLRQWRTRSVKGHMIGESCPVITAEKRGRKNAYLLTEVLDYMQWKDCSI